MFNFIIPENFIFKTTQCVLKRPGVNALRNTFETDLNLIAQITSGGGLRRFPDETGQM